MRASRSISVLESRSRYPASVTRPVLGLQIGKIIDKLGN